MTTAKTSQSFDPIERRKYIGASEIAAIMGLDRYRTPLDVYNDKMGLVAPFEGNNHTERGNALEAIAADYYTKQTGVKLRRINQEFVHKHIPFIRGHVDRVAVGEKRLIEIKCPSIAAFRKMQRDGLPESYIIQAQAYMELSGYWKLTYVIFCADIWDAAIFDIDRDVQIGSTAIQAARTFWREHVEPQVPPVDGVANYESMEFEKIGGDVIKRDDESFREAAMLLREADQLLKDANELHELGKKKVLDAIENEPGKYEGAGLRLSYSMQAGRKTFDKKLLAATHPEINLAAFEKQGEPFRSFRAFFTKEQEDD